MVKAVFPGSFDPPTNGHISILERASKIFDQVDVVIAVNSDKNYLFTQEERFNMISEIIKPFNNVTLHTCNELIVEYAKKTGADVILRGVRNATDCAYEFEISLMNHTVDPSIETVFMPTDPKNAVIRSSSVKELVKYGGNISGMVPEIVKNALDQKFKRG